jgi:CMP-N,N'-diacetyllegionaminic acid synthase
MSATPYILGVITARGDSKGIPGKNIKDLGGKPLIAYSIDAAKKSDLITHLIVSTDDEEIADVAKKRGCDVPFIRPKELAQDETPHLPVMQHAVKEMEDELGIVFDYVIIFQPTSPFRTKEDIDGTLKKLIDTGADSAVSVCEWNEAHPMKAKKLDGDDVLPYFEAETSTQRQELEKAYKRSGAAYAMKRDVIMNGEKPGDLYGKRTVGHIVPADRSIDIDTPLDWVKAEWILEDLKKKGFAF